MLIDTHTHLYLDEFSGDKTAAVNRALQAGIGKMIFPNVDRSTIEPMKELCHQCRQVTEMAMGLHPTEVYGRSALEQISFLTDELDSGEKYVAIGEIGIDLYWDKSHRERQMEVFERQMEIAAGRSLPVIIHCRDGLAEILEVIDGLERVPDGVFHSFGGSADDVEKIRRRGDFYFGINGIVTFKNSRLRESLPAIGVDRILLETDSPYLAPVPHRGKRNESAFMIHTAAYVANYLGMPLSELAEVTSRSACRIFGI